MKAKKKEVKKRRPKGMGTVVEYHDHPVPYFGAHITDGYHDVTGNQQQISLGYFNTRKEAEKCLLRHCLKMYSVMPTSIIGKDALEIEYTETIYNYQMDGFLDMDVKKFKFDKNICKINNINQLFINSILTSGRAIEMQTGFNKSHVIVQENIPTFKEVWETVSEQKLLKKAYKTINSYKVAFNHLKEIHDIPITQIKLQNLQGIFDNRMNLENGISTSSLNTMKVVCKYIFEWAVNNELVVRNYAESIYFEDTRSKEQKDMKKRIPFTIDEIKLIMKDNSHEAKIVLIYIFTGMRPIEFIRMENKDIHIKEKYMIGGAKTENGRNRIIPIHQTILPILEELMTDDCRILYPNICETYAYQKYNENIFKHLMAKLNMQHHTDPYDTRHTFATLAKKYKMDLFSTKKILGHSCKDITNDVYIHEPLDSLLEEINKISISL